MRVGEDGVEMLDICWHIAETEWDKARRTASANPPGSRYDSSEGAADLLRGRVQFAVDAAELFDESVLLAQVTDAAKPVPSRTQMAHSRAAGLDFWHRAAGLSVLDLALQLQGVLQFLRRPTAGEAPARFVFKDTDGSGWITFEVRAGSVAMHSNLASARHLDVSVEGVIAGIIRFSEEVARTIETEAPALLAWNSLAPLRHVKDADVAEVRVLNRTSVPEPDQEVAGGRQSGGLATAGVRSRADTGSFRIRWWPDALDWPKARAQRRLNPPGSYYDLGLRPRRSLLLGRVQPLCHDAEVALRPPLWYREEWFPREPQHRGWPIKPQQTVSDPATTPWPLIDLAWQAAREVNPAAFGRPPSLVPLPASRDPRAHLMYGEIRFTAAIRPSLLDEMRAACGSGAFAGGIRAFLVDFVAAIAQRAPELLDWECLAPLRAYDTFDKGSAAR